MSSGLEDFSLFELFRMEAEEQVHVLQTELLNLESNQGSAATLESLMRAAHSLKGAARIVGLDVIVRLMHAMEDRFVAAQGGRALSSGDVDRMLTVTDWLTGMTAAPETEMAAWLESHTDAIDSFTATFQAPSLEDPSVFEMPELDESIPFDSESHHEPTNPDTLVQIGFDANSPQPAAQPTTEPEEDVFGLAPTIDPATRERTVRITASRFDAVLAMASETLVSSRNLATRSEQLERSHRVLSAALQLLEDPTTPADLRANALREVDRQAAAFAATIAELDAVSRSNERTAERLYRTVLTGRLRPFSDGIGGVARLVRDTARNLGKQVRLEVLGENTRVDRDILERLEAPITHLISNAIDHGIESPDDRLAAGKPTEALLRLNARHENGRLVISVRDDGRGIEYEALRARIVSRNLVTAETAAGLSERELLEFLFLPGFSTREQVSDISGRGVGLNVVQSMVQEAGGSVTVTAESGAGTVFRMTLPVTRSVIKVIRVQVEGELYAVPLVRIDRVAKLEPILREGMFVIEHDEEHLPIISLGHLLGLSAHPPPSGVIPLLLSGGIAFAVDRFVDEVELPVRRLDSRLGKIPGVSAASLDENGNPLLILDMEDLVQTAHGRPTNPADTPHRDHLAPHILIVDDSHTVREMERRILVRAGYHVTTAQNGAEAWNLLRMNDYDLLVSDVDMPQMNGIELVTRLRDNPRLARMPVIILSYKDRAEDRKRGLDAGADFYLTKGDFQNNAFLQAVVDLIGSAEPGP
jgi:two-component system sensor histidine kinase and response regulator WspE